MIEEGFLIAEILPSQTTTPRILLIEDDEVASQAAEDQLNMVWSDVDVRHVATIEEALPLAAGTWDVALLDLGLPGCTGLQALHLLAAAAPHVPIVVLTAQDEEELAIGALREKAQDYLSKRNIDAEHLARSIRYAVERHRNLSQLRASERNLLNLIDAHVDGVLVVNEEGTVVYANATARNQLDVRQAGLVGRSVAELPVAQAEVGRRLETPQGESRIVDVRTIPIDWKGETAQMIVVHDVTERHHAEQIRLQMQHNERLAAIGTLSAGIAHEINNPLTYVLGCLEILRRDLTKPKKEEEGPPAYDASFQSEGRAQQLVDRAVDGIERVVAIVRNLGKFSRTDDELRAKSTPLAPVIRTAVETASPHLRHRACVVVEVDEEIHVEASSGPLTQVFVNLLVNAAHAIEVGNVDRNSVTVRAWKLGEEALVTIQDTGRGIPEEQLSRLFDPFFTTKASGEGTGLGLYVCRSILESLGGSIRVESTTGFGTCFTVRLRLWTDSDDDQVAQEEAPPPSVHAARRKIVGARVLVVDDEKFIRQAIQMSLANTCEVVVAESSRDAITKLSQNESFDLILCDIVMDDGSGLELRDWIEVARPDLRRKLLFMSGGSLRDTSVEVLGHEVLNKPFRQEDLLNRISGALASVPPPPLKSEDG